MKDEYILGFIAGLVILAYVLDAVVNPLTLTVALTTPYQYFRPDIFTQYAFTSTSIILKALAVFLAPVWLLSNLGVKALTKGISLLIFSGLLQLYTLQDVVTRQQVLPLEWDISLTLAGVALLMPSVIYLLIGFFSKVSGGLADTSEPEKDFWKEKDLS